MQHEMDKEDKLKHKKSESERERQYILYSMDYWKRMGTPVRGEDEEIEKQMKK